METRRGVWDEGRFPRTQGGARIILACADLPN